MADPELTPAGGAKLYYQARSGVLSALAPEFQLFFVGARRITRSA